MSDTDGNGAGDHLDAGCLAALKQFLGARGATVAAAAPAAAFA